MKAKLFACLGVVALGLSMATAQQNANLLPPVVNELVVQPDNKQKDKDKKDEKKLADPPATDFFTRTPEPIRDALGYNPHMMGDLQGKFANVSATIFATQTITQTTRVLTPFPITTVATQTALIPVQRTFYVPVPNYGPFKVAENASPLPIDRVYFSYNYWNSIRYSPAPNGPVSQTQSTVLQLRGGATIRTDVTTTLPASPTPFVDLHREVFGFEKTFLDGRGSVEFRLPVYQQLNGGDDFRASHMGDITIIGKYALFLDRDTGDVLSAGLAITTPTSPGINTVDGRVHDTLLQPWFGYVVNWDRLYVNAFHSCVFPTDSRDGTVFFNDVGVGYWLRRDDDALIRFIVPTIEAHVTTPLSNRDISSPIYMPDQVALTGGVHLGVGRRGILSIGVVAPVTGPRTYSMEGFAQFNFRF